MKGLSTSPGSEQHAKVRVVDTFLVVTNSGWGLIRGTGNGLIPGIGNSGNGGVECDLANRLIWWSSR